MNGVPPLPTADLRRSYFARWQQLSRPARLYLVHIALLTTSLAIVGLFYNLAVLALGFSLDFLGLLNTVSFVAATALGVPLLWLVARVRLRLALLVSAGLQLASTLLFVLWPVAPVLLLASVLGGVAAVLFQVSAAPFMMRHSDAAARDHLFSANTAIAIGLAGLGSLVAGQLPRWFAGWLQVGAESALAYRAAFAVASIGLLLALLPLLALGAEREATTDDRRRTTDDRPTDQATRRPGDQATRRPGDQATRRPGDQRRQIVLARALLFLRGCCA